jgi:NADH:ubiquinone oxidoreductase subunit 6 (subunit J)
MPASEVLVNVVFYVFAAAAVAGSVAVAASRNIVRSAFALLAVLFSAAAMYALMRADFIAGVQVLVYVGGILVLIIFAVMLTHRITDVKLSNESAPGPAAFFACVCLLFSLAVVVLFAGRWKRGPEPLRARAAELAPGKGGTVDLELLQYQADGRTGIERGGGTFEERVVLEVRCGRPAEGASDVEVEVTPEGGTASVRSEPLGPGGIARVELAGLEERPYNWRVRLVGPDGKGLTAWVPYAEGGPAFRVYRGLTRPLGYALAGPYLFAFEAISVLLLAALVGAAYLARKEVKE